MHPVFIFILIAAAFFSSPARAAVINNGGFETGDLTGWTLSNGSPFDQVCQAGGSVGASTCVVNSGTYAMTFGSFQSIATLSQTVATVPGNTYQISFYLSIDGPNSLEEELLSMRWGGATVFSLSNPSAAFPFTQQVILNLVASSVSTLLEFDAQNDPSQWYLDDVSISDASPVPEPGSITLLGAALAALATACLRNRGAGC